MNPLKYTWTQESNSRVFLPLVRLWKQKLAWIWLECYSLAIATTIANKEKTFKNVKRKI